MFGLGADEDVLHFFGVCPVLGKIRAAALGQKTLWGDVAPLGSTAWAFRPLLGFRITTLPLTFRVYHGDAVEVWQNVLYSD